MLQRFPLVMICMVFGFVLSVHAQDDPPSNTENQPTLTVWLPAPLIADTESEAFKQLLSHTTQFSLENDIRVEYRIKAVGQMGGIMSTIRSGSVVAPGALPDVTLIRRVDLISAQTPTVLQSLETLFSSALLNDFDNSLVLGQIVQDESLELYGLPYFLDIQHAVLNQSLDELSTNLTFEDVLNSADSLLIAAGRSNGLNQIFYLQYLAAGGVPPRNGIMMINQNALRTVLEFYETAVEQDLITPTVLDYNSPSAYRTDFMNSRARVDVGIFSSSEYFSMLQQDSSLIVTSIPTANGEPITTLDGWVWVMVTPEPSQQDLAVRYLNWMMQPDFHSALSRELNRLPAQQSAIVDSLPSEVDPLFIDSLLSHAVLPLPESEGGTIPRAMQDALASVINGEASAEEATLTVIEQFGRN